MDNMSIWNNGEEYLPTSVIRNNSNNHVDMSRSDHINDSSVAGFDHNQSLYYSGANVVGYVNNNISPIALTGGISKNNLRNSLDNGESFNSQQSLASFTNSDYDYEYDDSNYSPDNAHQSWNQSAATSFSMDARHRMSGRDQFSQQVYRDSSPTNLEPPVFIQDRSMSNQYDNFYGSSDAGFNYNTQFIAPEDAMQNNNIRYRNMPQSQRPSQAINQYAMQYGNLSQQQPHQQQINRNAPLYQQQGVRQQQIVSTNRSPMSNYGNSMRPGMMISNMQSQQQHITSQTPGTGGSNAQGRAINKMLLDVLRARTVDPNRLALIVDANIERMDCVNLATLLFHTGKKRLLLTPLFIKRIATRFALLAEQLRAREASNALYGLKCMSSDCVEVRQLVLALAHKVSTSASELVAQAVGNALYGCQMMTSEHEEVRFLLQVLAVKVSKCTELLEAQNVGNALYGLRGMNTDHKEVKTIIAALTPKIATAKEDLNGQALGNSLYGLQGMSAKEIEVRNLVSVLAEKVIRCWEDLKAQEVGNALYGLKRMNSDIPEIRELLDALVPKIEASPEILDAQAIGNSFYGMQNMKSDNPSVLKLLSVMAIKVSLSNAELDGQAMGNSLYGLQGMKSEFEEVRAVVREITAKLETSTLEMNAQELGNALYGLQNMTSDYPEVRSLLVALARKVASSKHDLTSQEIGNALYGLQGMKSDTWETRLLVRQLAIKVTKSTALLDPQGIANSLYGFQRMSSESEEVRMLIQALALKIDQSWKLLNAQHVANSLYGLQNLSTFEVEVANLVRSLVPKILSCRDDMTSKQISCAFFGLQSMYSHHEDVLSLIGALTEKVILSKDPMTGLQLGGALFGLQGLDDNSVEVRKLIGAFANKILNNVKDYDASNLGNCYYGLQRLSTNTPEVIELLNALSPLVLSLIQKGIELNPLVCSNILYGLQNCDCTIPSVRDVLLVISTQISEITNKFLNTSSSTSSLSTPNSNGSMSVRSTSSSGKSVSGGTTLVINIPTFHEIKKLYQCLTLVSLTVPNLDVDIQLYESFTKHQQSLLHIIETRKNDPAYNSSLAFALTSPTFNNSVIKLSVPQMRLAEGTRILLNDEPFDVVSGELIHGFEATTLISLKPNLNLTLTSPSANSSLLWEPMLNIEILGSSHTFPAKDLFTRLRNRFFESKNIVVEMVHASMVASNSFGKGLNAKKAMIETLRNQDHLFQALLPPTVQDAAQFASLLYSQGICGPQGIMSSMHEYSVDVMIERYNQRHGIVTNSNSNNPSNSSNSFFAVGTLDTGYNFDGFSGSSTFEYTDDNLLNDGLGYNNMPMSLNGMGGIIGMPGGLLELAPIVSTPTAMNENWIGESPKLSSPTTMHTPSPRSVPTTSAGNRVFDFSNVSINSSNSSNSSPNMLNSQQSSSPILTGMSQMGNMTNMGIISMSSSKTTSPTIGPTNGVIGMMSDLPMSYHGAPGMQRQSMNSRSGSPSSSSPLSGSPSMVSVMSQIPMLSASRSNSPSSIAEAAITAQKQYNPASQHQIVYQPHHNHRPNSTDLTFNRQRSNSPSMTPNFVNPSNRFAMSASNGNMTSSLYSNNNDLSRNNNPSNQLSNQMSNQLSHLNISNSSESSFNNYPSNINNVASMSGGSILHNTGSPNTDPITNDSSDEEVDEDTKLLETQLQIKLLEAKLLQMRKQKVKNKSSDDSISGTSSMSSDLGSFSPGQLPGSQSPVVSPNMHHFGNSFNQTQVPNDGNIVDNHSY